MKYSSEFRFQNLNVETIFKMRFYYVKKKTFFQCDYQQEVLSMRVAAQNNLDNLIIEIIENF